MSNPKTIQIITDSINTYSLSANDCNRNDSEARYQRISEIIHRDLIGQRRHSLQSVESSSRLSSDLVVTKSIEAGDQDPNDPITATNPEIHDLAMAVNNKCDAESITIGQVSRSP